MLHRLCGRTRLARFGLVEPTGAGRIDRRAAADEVVEIGHRHARRRHIEVERAIGLRRRGGEARREGCGAAAGLLLPRKTPVHDDIRPAQDQCPRIRQGREIDDQALPSAADVGLAIGAAIGEGRRQRDRDMGWPNQREGGGDTGDLPVHTLPQGLASVGRVPAGHGQRERIARDMAVRAGPVAAAPGLGDDEAVDLPARIDRGDEPGRAPNCDEHDEDDEDAGLLHGWAVPPRRGGSSPMASRRGIREPTVALP